MERLRLALRSIGPARLAALAAALAAGASQGAPALPPARAYASLPAMHGVRLSPDGNRVLMLRRVGRVAGAPQLFVGDLRAGKMAQPFHFRQGRKVLRRCGWATNARIVCSWFDFSYDLPRGRAPGPPKRAEPAKRAYPARAGGLLRLLAVDHDGGNLLQLVPRYAGNRLFDFPDGTTMPAPFRDPWFEGEHRIVHYLPRDPEHILVETVRKYANSLAVYRLNIHDNALKRVTPEARVDFWSADERGRVRIGVGLASRDHQDTPLLWVEDGAGGFTTVDAPHLGAPRFPPKVLGFTMDGESAYVESHDAERRRTVVWQVAAKDLRAERLVAAHPRRDMVLTPIRGAACGIVGFAEAATGEFTWLDEALGREVEALSGPRGKVPGIRAVPSMSADCMKLVLLADDGALSPGYYLHDRASGRTSRLGSQRPALDGRLAAKERVAYRTRDGRDFEATFTRPAPRSEALPPLVVMPIGGPYPPTAGFDPWAEFLASRGYAVLRPAGRGAPGRGASHWEAGYEVWGARLQDDLADAVAWAVAEGRADPERVCYAGRGHDGYLALAGAFGAATLALGELRDVPKDHRVRHHGWKWGSWLRTPVARGFGLIYRPDEDGRLSAWRSPLLGADHAGFPVEVETDAGPVTYENNQHPPVRAVAHPGFPVLIADATGPETFDRGGRRFSERVAAAGRLDRLTPPGSRREVAFLEALERFLEQHIGRGD